MIYRCVIAIRDILKFIPKLGVSFPFHFRSTKHEAGQRHISRLIYGNSFYGHLVVGIKLFFSQEKSNNCVKCKFMFFKSIFPFEIQIHDQIDIHFGVVFDISIYL